MQKETVLKPIQVLHSGVRGKQPASVSKVQVRGYYRAQEFAAIAEHSLSDKRARQIMIYPLNEAQTKLPLEQGIYVVHIPCGYQREQAIRAEFRSLQK